MIILYILIGITALISWKGWEDTSFFRKYMFHVGSIRAGEHFRMLTSGFLHGDLTHLAFNMISLYFFAPVVIYQFGLYTFLFLYGSSLLAGSMLTLYFYKNQYHYTAIGASGAVTGIIYAAILLYPDMDLYLFFIPIPIKAYLFGIGYLLYSIYGMKAQNDGIGHAAHFGGAIAGLFFTLLKVPHLIFKQPLLVAGLILPIVILFFMERKRK
ncbi:rhomboid family intramembrane serine protease [Flavobacterium sp.]|jgi:membrane associated rhomboid family serine protease|uniref:rhomboid family intramembrane serine protease n=1 Tax=Flavobacterium sp. TaxID=239 RepID=UPI003340F5B5